MSLTDLEDDFSDADEGETLNNFPDFDPETGQLVVPDGKTTDKPLEPSAEAKRIADLEAEVGALKTRPAAPVYVAPQHQHQTAPAVDLNELNTKLASEILTNPAGFLANFRKTIIDEVEAKNEPVKHSAVTTAIKSFKRSVIDDPLFSQAEPFFDDLVSRIKPSDVKNVSYEEIDDRISDLYNLAVGKSIRQGNTQIKRDSDPPPYGAGSGIAGAARAAAGRGALSAEEKSTVSAARAMGLDDASIAKMLAAGRRNKS